MDASIAQKPLLLRIRVQILPGGGSAIHGCLVFRNHFGADAFAAGARRAIKLARELLTTPALKALSKHAFSLQQSKNKQNEIIHITIYVASILGRTRLPSIVRKPIPTLLILLFNLCIFKKNPCRTGTAANQKTA